MTCKKADLIKSVMENVHLKNRKRKGQQFLFPELDYTMFPKKRAASIVDALFEIIKSRLVRGENVLISNFGKFQVKFKWARKGRDPRTGKAIILDSRRVVSFRVSPGLKEKMRGKT
ncbi:MAG: HU family DNA-binding protein [Pseudomonadota bacterium]